MKYQVIEVDSGFYVDIDGYTKYAVARPISKFFKKSAGWTRELVEEAVELLK